MPQFDIFSLSSFINYCLATIVSMFFYVILFRIALDMLERVVQLVLNGTLKAELKNFKNYIKSFFSAGLLNFDLMEQFVFTPSLSLVVFVFLVFAITFFFVYAIDTSRTLYVFVGELTHSINSGNRASAGKHIPFYYVIFVFVLIFNLVGTLPYAFTLTGSLAVPAFLSSTIFFAWAYTLIRNFGVGALAGFLPSGTGPAIVPLVALIEIVSGFSKFLSLGIRLFANMFAGHLLLKVLYSAIFLTIVPCTGVAYAFSQISIIVFSIFIVVLEALIAFLQAFVFMLLTIIYFKETNSFARAH